jgi:hypothetical protein
LKPGGFKLWVNWIQVVQPPPRVKRAVNRVLLRVRRDVAVVQVDPFWKANFETETETGRTTFHDFRSKGWLGDQALSSALKMKG